MPDLLSTYAVLSPDLRVTHVDVTPTIWSDLDRMYSGFAGHVLVSRFDFSTDWPSWERHPAGDEVVVLLSGSGEFVLQEAGGERLVALSRPGEFVVVPKGTWHTCRISQPTSMIFITPGEGTENRPV